MSEDKKNKEVKSNWLETILPKIRPGVTIKVHQKIKEKNTKGEEKQRVQIFEGIVLARRGGSQKNATITVRKVAAGGIGVERIFPLFSPNIARIEVTKSAQVNRAKLYYLRSYKKKLKEKQA
ncbi:MAG: 50S ribosomal protein L19 [Patescibacteria group bacterium]